MSKVSIIIPCRNEQKYIGKVLECLINQNYPKEDLEVFFIDGNSDDNTRQIINQYAEKWSWIKLLINENRYVPYAMNLGIEKSSGEIIMRLDAHASYPEFYISKLVQWLEKLNADNVGGTCITRPGSDTFTGIAISHALSHPFGVGNSYFRTGITEFMEVDTVPFGCYRKSVFDRVGLYNIKLIRNQDIELNKRLKNAGGKIFLVPDVYSIYYSRDSFGKLSKNNFENGKWVILTAYYTGTFASLSIRHFVPLFFIMYMLALPVLLLFSIFFVLPFMLHCLLNMYFSVKIGIREKNILLIPLVWFSFLFLHISYGFGSIAGLIDIAFKKK